MQCAWHFRLTDSQPTECSLRPANLPHQRHHKASRHNFRFPRHLLRDSPKRVRFTTIPLRSLGAVIVVTVCVKVICENNFKPIPQNTASEYLKRGPTWRRASSTTLFSRVGLRLLFLTRFRDSPHESEGPRTGKHSRNWLSGWVERQDLEGTFCRNAIRSEGCVPMAGNAR